MLNICRRRRSKIVSQRTGDGFALKIAKIRRLRNTLIHSRLRNMALRPCPDGFAKKPISASDIGYIGSRLSPFHAAKCTIRSAKKPISQNHPPSDGPRLVPDGVIWTFLPPVVSLD